MTLNSVKAVYFVLWHFFMCVCVCVGGGGCLSLIFKHVGQHMGFWYLSHLLKKHPLKAHVDIPSSASDLNISLSLHLHSYFVYESREGSGGTAHISKLT